MNDPGSPLSNGPLAEPSTVEEPAVTPRRIVRSGLGPIAILLAGLAADSSEPAPRLTSLVPPGVAVGGRETWTIRGRNLAGVDRIDVEGEGVEAVLKSA